MFDDQMQKKVFGPEEQEIGSGGITSRKEDFLYFILFANIVRVIKSRRGSDGKRSMLERNKKHF